LKALLEALESPEWRRGSVKTKLADRTRGGQHKPGTIAKAVLQALAAADNGLRFGEICARVDESIGETVSRSSIKESLRRRMRKVEPEISRSSADGRYRLRQTYGV
jgi:hypothetical protein